jgi:hypothetical protein
MPTPTRDLPKFDFDVISQPAMPPPEPLKDQAGLAKAADPRHNPARGEQR